MKKTLVRFLGARALAWGVCVLSIPASAQTSGSVSFILSYDAASGAARQSLPQVVSISNQGSGDATNVTVTFTPPKGVSVKGSCQVDHLPGGIRSYTCSVGTIPSGGSADLSFSISMNKPGDASFNVDVTCDQSASATIWLPINVS